MSQSKDEEKYGIMAGQMCWFPTADDEENDWFLRMLPDLKKQLNLKELAQD